MDLPYLFSYLVLPPPTESFQSVQHRVRIYPFFSAFQFSINKQLCIFHLEPFILTFGAIHFNIQSHSSKNLDLFILTFGDIHLDILSSPSCNVYHTSPYHLIAILSSFYHLKDSQSHVIIFSSCDHLVITHYIIIFIPHQLIISLSHHLNFS